MYERKHTLACWTAYDQKQHLHEKEKKKTNRKKYKKQFMVFMGFRWYIYKLLDIFICNTLVRTFVYDWSLSVYI